MVGGAPSQLQGRTVASLTYPGDEQLLPETATEAPVDEADPAVEKRYRHLDGHEVWVAVQSSIVRDHGGDPLYNIAQIRDLTEHRALEARVRQGQKMEAIGSLASGVAHDFNNVLSIIRGASGLLLRDLEDSESRELVGEIDLAAEHASALTKQLLAFGRKQLLQPQPTAINELVEDTLQMVRSLLSMKVTIERDLPPDLPLIQIDPNQFAQILLNLSANASDAMPEGGTLTIRTRAVTLDQQYAADHPEVEAGPYVLLEVNDSGTGLDAASIEHIFDPFFTTKETGTGLGLATVYGIVKQSGGHLTVYSEPGMGANFKIYLPISDRSDVVEVERATSGPPPKLGRTILLVDDFDGLRSVLERLLKSAGYTVLAAADGIAALELARGHEGSIDVLLTDVVMPNMGGPELFAALQASHPGTKVIFTSGYPGDSLMREDITAGHVAFIQKPFTNDDLLAKVSGTLA